MDISKGQLFEHIVLGHISLSEWLKRWKRSISWWIKNIFSSRLAENRNLRFDVVILITFPGPNAPNNALPKISLLKSGYCYCFQVFLWSFRSSFRTVLKVFSGTFLSTKVHFIFFLVPRQIARSINSHFIDKETYYWSRVINYKKYSRFFKYYKNNVNIISIKLWNTITGVI